MQIRTINKLTCEHAFGIIIIDSLPYINLCNIGFDFGGMKTVEIEECIKDAFEDSMQLFVQTEEYKKERDEINDMIITFRAMLDVNRQLQFNEIVDAITVADGKLASEAYLHGVVEGIALREKIIG